MGYVASKDATDTTVHPTLDISTDGDLVHETGVLLEAYGVAFDIHLMETLYFKSTAAFIDKSFTKWCGDIGNLRVRPYWIHKGACLGNEDLSGGGGGGVFGRRLIGVLKPIISSLKSEEQDYRQN